MLPTSRRRAGLLAIALLCAAATGCRSSSEVIEAADRPPRTATSAKAAPSTTDSTAVSVPASAVEATATTVAPDPATDVAGGEELTGPIVGRDIAGDPMQQPGGRGPVAAAPASGPLVDGSSGAARSAVVVKIDNAPGAWPQAGLNQADVTFELLVEGMSRFAAVFHSENAVEVGPIRSARTSDLNLVAMLGRPAFAWSGGNSGVRAAVATASVVDVGAETSPGAYYRAEGGRVIPHNLMSSTAALRSAGVGATVPPPIFSYGASPLAPASVATPTRPSTTPPTTRATVAPTSSTAPRVATTVPVATTSTTSATSTTRSPSTETTQTTARAATSTTEAAFAGRVVPIAARQAVDDQLVAIGGVEVDIGGTRSMFLWDATVERWRRYQSGWAHLDADGVQVTPTNVVVLETPYLPSPADARSPEAQTLGSGGAWVLVDGAAIAGTWSRTAPGEPYTLLAADGRRIRLQPGRTWVSLPPPGGSVRFVDRPFAEAVLAG